MNEEYESAAAASPEEIPVQAPVTGSPAPAEELPAEPAWAVPAPSELLGAEAVPGEVPPAAAAPAESAPVPPAEPAPAPEPPAAEPQAPVYRPAPAPDPYSQQPVQPAQPVQPVQPAYPYGAKGAPGSTEPRPGRKSPYAPMNTAGIALQLFLMNIPVLGLILSIIWACGVCRKITRRNLARAHLILLIISLILVVAGALVLRFCFPDELTRAFEQAFPGYTIKWG